MSKRCRWPVRNWGTTRLLAQMEFQQKSSRKAAQNAFITFTTSLWRSGSKRFQLNSGMLWLSQSSKGFTKLTVVITEATPSPLQHRRYLPVFCLIDLCQWWKKSSLSSSSSVSETAPFKVEKGMNHCPDSVGHLHRSYSVHHWPKPPIRGSRERCQLPSWWNFMWLITDS